MIPLESIQAPLDKLIQQCSTRNPEAIVSAAMELSRALGQTRANELLQNELARREGVVIFDVGANEGIVAETYRQMFPAATIHAFEPHPQAFSKLQQKFRGDDKVILNNCGVADIPGKLQFNAANQSGSSSFLSFSPSSPYVRGTGLSTVDSFEVAVTSIDDYCRLHGIRRIDFMKMDVQGFESRVLSGASGMLARHAIGLIQTEIVFRDFYEESSSFSEIEQSLKPHGYSLRTIYDIYPAEGVQIFQCDAIYSYTPKPRIAEPFEGDPNAVLSEAQAHQGAGRLGEARALYARLLRSFPEHATLLAIAGSIDFQEGRHESARDLLMQSLDVEPGNKDVLFWLGMAYARLGEAAAAIDCFELLPENAAAQTELGKLLVDRATRVIISTSDEKPGH
jgi:FkbM family methyltransferase